MIEFTEVTPRGDIQNTTVALWDEDPLLVAADHIVAIKPWYAYAAYDERLVTLHLQGGWSFIVRQPFDDIEEFAEMIRHHA